MASNWLRLGPVMAHVGPLSLIQIWATPGPSFFVACGLWEKGLCTWTRAGTEKNAMWVLLSSNVDFIFLKGLLNCGPQSDLMVRVRP